MATSTLKHKATKFCNSGPDRHWYSFEDIGNPSMVRVFPGKHLWCILSKENCVRMFLRVTASAVASFFDDIALRKFNLMRSFLVTVNLSFSVKLMTRIIF